MSEDRAVSIVTNLAIGNEKLKLNLIVPVDEVPPESMLPVLHQLSNRIVGGLEEKVDKREGMEISCKKGCGACCRQHVPISPPEARLLSEMIEDMPEERRIQLKKRFKQAALRLQDSGLLRAAMYYNNLTEDETRAMVKDYFELGIACPFLEEESCSIHANRPLICREYLVISSPEYCASLEEEKIQTIDMPVSISECFGEMDGVRPKEGNQYLPLIMALEWVERFPDEAEFRPGPEWVQDFFAALSEKQIPGD
jgi:Fe-S-cluster containining protein